jgi:hypothetical protein
MFDSVANAIRHKFLFFNFVDACLEEAERLKQSQCVGASSEKDESENDDESENMEDERSDGVVEHEQPEDLQARSSLSQSDSAKSDDDEKTTAQDANREKEVEKEAEKIVLHSMFSPQARKNRLVQTKEQR